MERRKLPYGDIEVSTLGVGCNQFGRRVDAHGVERLVHAALDNGVNHFDTADHYGGVPGGSERMLGAALKGRRDQAVIATKFGMPMTESARTCDGSAAYIPLAVEASLKRLGTDYIDLLYLHYQDPDTPPEETVAALDKVWRAGKIRASACSNVTVGYLERSVGAALQKGQSPYVAVQDEYSLLYRAAEDLLPSVRDLGLCMIPYYPLASGLLSGRYRKGAPAPENARLSGNSVTGPRFLTPANLDIVEELVAFAESRGRTLLDLAFGWLLAKPEIPSVIAGVSSVEQFSSNVVACTARLSAQEVMEIDRIVASKAADPGVLLAPHEQLKLQIRERTG